MSEWNVKSVEKEVYIRSTEKNLKNVFNRGEFADLNKDKVDSVEYLLVCKGNSVRFAFTIGIRGNEVFCPFSAPFSYPETIKEGMSIDNYEKAICVLEEYFKSLQVEKVHITFPPDFYDKATIEVWMNMFFYSGWEIETIDINFSFCLPDIIDNYKERIAHNARKNLRIAEEAGLELHHCVNIEEKRRSYNIIKNNRIARGYPLRMSEEQVLQTIQLVDSDMYIVSCEGEEIAAALIYNVTNEVAQVVYWGDLPGHPEKKVINFLAYELVKLYHSRGFKHLDIGPSTENGVPNYGLCDFKDSIGCERTAKFKWYKKYR